jgi:ion channel-forming bestrophin family protein
MIITRNIKWNLILFYTWKSLLYYTLLSIVVYLLHDYFRVANLSVPFTAITAIGTALAIYLGFKNNSAYERWWEARKLWGSLINYSRVLQRQINCFIVSEKIDEQEVALFKERILLRHIAYVNALRVFLRIPNGYNVNPNQELYEESNEYEEIRKFLPEAEFKIFYTYKNAPNYLLSIQGEEIKAAFEKRWISDYRFVRLEETLIEFNQIQGGCERIKNTPFLRQFSFFSRVFVFIHASLIPFAFVKDLGWSMIPLSILISFVFLALDLIGDRTEDPFENRLEDIPLNAICVTIERDIKEGMGESVLPKAIKPSADGVLL